MMALIVVSSGFSNVFSKEADDSVKLLHHNITLSSASLLKTLENPEETTINAIIQSLAPYRVLLTSTLEQQLCWGGFPEVLLLNDDANRQLYLGSYLQTYLEKDIRDIKNISDLSLYQHLMQIIAKQTGSLRDDGKILAALSCSRNTLIKYRDYL